MMKAIPISSISLLALFMLYVIFSSRETAKWREIAKQNAVVPDLKLVEKKIIDTEVVLNDTSTRQKLEPVGKPKVVTVTKIKIDTVYRVDTVHRVDTVYTMRYRINEIFEYSRLNKPYNDTLDIIIDTLAKTPFTIVKRVLSRKTRKETRFYLALKGKVLEKDEIVYLSFEQAQEISNIISQARKSSLKVTK